MIGQRIMLKRYKYAMTCPSVSTTMFIQQRTLDGPFEQWAVFGIDSLVSAFLLPAHNPPARPTICADQF